MQLVHRDATLDFTMQTTHEPPLAGSEKPVIVRQLHYPKIGLGGFSVQETADILKEALESFKGIYGLHSDEHVRVVFSD